MVLANKKACSSIPPIAKVKSLASILSIGKEELLDISNSTNSLWKKGKLLRKKSGEPRPTLDAKPRLKELHEKIKNRMLKQVYYPTYLLGGIEDKMTPRDYKRHAEIHSRKSILINEDIKDFFPNSTVDVVDSIWKYLFRCTPEVSTILTKITTLNGSLPQGWKTSGYLANLVFWDLEPELVEKLAMRGFSYSRFMDDITVSSKIRINNMSKTFVINEVYGMLLSKGYSPKRSKHQIVSSGDRMVVTGLTVNGKSPSLSKKDQNNIRAAVHKCESHAKGDRTSIVYEKLWNSASGRVGMLTRFNMKKGAELRRRLRVVKPMQTVEQWKRRD